MRLILTYDRRSGDPVDLMVTADATVTVGQLARALAERDPSGGCRLVIPTLALNGDILPASLSVADSRLQSGAVVRLYWLRPVGHEGADERGRDAKVGDPVLGHHLPRP